MIIWITTGSKLEDFCKQLFKNLRILLLQSQHLYPLIMFVVNNILFTTIILLNVFYILLLFILIPCYLILFQNDYNTVCVCIHTRSFSQVIRLQTYTSTAPTSRYQTIWIILTYFFYLQSMFYANIDVHSLWMNHISSKHVRVLVL